MPLEIPRSHWAVEKNSKRKKIRIIKKWTKWKRNFVVSGTNCVIYLMVIYASLCSTAWCFSYLEKPNTLLFNNCHHYRAQLSQLSESSPDAQPEVAYYMTKLQISLLFNLEAQEHLGEEKNFCHVWFPCQRVLQKAILLGWHEENSPYGFFLEPWPLEGHSALHCKRWKHIHLLSSLSHGWGIISPIEYLFCKKKKR